MLWRFVYNLLVNVSYCVFKDFVGWERWLTRQLEKPGWRIKLLKGFFSKPPCCTPEFPPFYPYVSLSLPLKVHMCICLRAREKRKADQGFFALRKDSKCCEKHNGSFGVCPRPLKKTFEWFESRQERSLFQRGGRLKSSFERKGLHFV